MTKTELFLGVATLASASMNIALGWKFGGKQKQQNDNTDAVTRGVDTVTNINERLLDRMDKMIAQTDVQLEAERLRTKEERDHREMCEKSLKEHREMLDHLQQEIEQIKKNEM